MGFSRPTGSRGLKSGSGVVIDEAFVRVTLADGRELAAPLEWFPRLRDASPDQRGRWRLIGRGQGLH
nr:DUF2442 domain-containing protein [Rhodospirillum rubrum]